MRRRCQHCTSARPLFRQQQVPPNSQQPNPSQTLQCHCPNYLIVMHDGAVEVYYRLACFLNFATLQCLTERSKVSYTITLFTGHALEWAMPLWLQKRVGCSSQEYFEKALSEMFFQLLKGKDAGDRILILHQGSQLVVYYTIRSVFVVCQLAQLQIVLDFTWLQTHN